MSYDTNNIFARILRQEIQCNKVFEDEFCLAFTDLHPAAPIHVLVIPKENHTDFSSFCSHASPNQIVGFFQGVTKTLEKLGLSSSNGYRLITNCGLNGCQTVSHFHIHILGGKKLGPLIITDTYHE